ncbi:hypothetical protein C1I99_08320 [Micromonospora deserti]|uniref:Uncharacterized protein n=1 Tax=Micromonospora deserti TaxID=2070366 RepID=A0A2W2DV80_9ACTN|nr:hypothetical protein C1I99_08320 [Micromonospora deserti]
MRWEAEPTVGRGDQRGHHGPVSSKSSEGGFGGDLLGLDLGDTSADDVGVGAAGEGGAVADQSGGAGG